MPNLLVLKEYRLGAFSSRGRGLFFAPDRAFLFWQSRAAQTPEFAAPPPPQNPGPGMLALPKPPEATAKSREEKRFSRADKDKNGRIEREEILGSRRKAFAKLDTNGNGTLSFEEWAVKSIEKFGVADKDRSGWLTSAEFATTALLRRRKSAVRVNSVFNPTLLA
ncbi:EF-hand domain-containing protein [Sphingomonas daechungensis]|nr:EF-hand domain-containing protein [Sphingomonas daechungensis]